MRSAAEAAMGCIKVKSTSNIGYSRVLSSCVVEYKVAHSIGRYPKTPEDFNDNLSNPEACMSACKLQDSYQ
jgi:hypothetical protein